MKLQTFVSFQTQGMRPAQEDCVVTDLGKGLAIVADGFGGEAPGARAAQLACEATRSFLFREAGDLEATLPFMIRPYFSLAGNVLFNALIHANREVRKSNKDKGPSRSGGASVLAGFLDGALLALAGVGSCEAWLFRGADSARVVQPRSFAWLQDPVAGRLPDGGLDAPLRALGMAEDLEPELVEIRVRPGDWILWQTDGVTSGARQQLWEAYRRYGGVTGAAEEVLRGWRDLAFEDNAAAAVAIVGD